MVERKCFLRPQELTVEIYVQVEDYPCIHENYIENMIFQELETQFDIHNLCLIHSIKLKFSPTKEKFNHHQFPNYEEFSLIINDLRILYLIKYPFSQIEYITQEKAYAANSSKM